MRGKLLLAPVLIAAACMMAGIYGAVHDQISYTVSPGYFHEFKFIQFDLRQSLQNRLGAAVVGWLASWWMGLIIGVPICLSALTVRGVREFVRSFLLASLTVIAVTLLVGLTGLAVGILTIQNGNLPFWMAGRHVTDPVAFARAGMMHNFSYLGGMIGLIAGIAVVIRQAMRSRSNAARDISHRSDDFHG